MDEDAGGIVKVWYKVLSDQTLLIEALAARCTGKFVVLSSFYFAIDEGCDI